ncbi:procathepsin L-like [Haliotis rufescens]|uniref:procathepsin L-like n=1 Tax=Haliotis rufescens TaxID=6454 RepID=UPI001EAFCABD|nr:procathepsin L-like [Haliotis rufescens]
MKAACAVFILALTSSSIGAPQDLQQRWGEWQVKHGRRYSSQGEEEGRRRAWQVNQDWVKGHKNRGDADLSMEMNQFADGTQPGRQLLHPSAHSPTVDIIHNNMSPDNDVSPTRPKSFDWRSKGVISPINNEDQFGNNFAVVDRGCVESFQAIKTGNLVGLSTWEIVDCCPLAEDDFFDCIHNLGGLCSANDYPLYTGQCRNNTCQAVGMIQGGKAVPAGQVDQMVDALLERPLAVLIDSSAASFERYQNGIYNDTDCSRTEVGHAMQVVGYGEEDGQEFWICKNTWGNTWGDQGYVRMKKGADTCGIESHASYPY